MEFLKECSIVIGFAVESSPLDDWDAQVALSQQQRRKRQKLEDPLAKLRLLKSDIRKTYATMFTNVMNSNDLTLIYGFLDTFLTSTAYQATGCQRDEFSSTQYFSLLNGVTSMFRFWCSTLSQIPDAVVRIQHTSINLPDFVGCDTTISTYFTLECTRIYDDEFPVRSSILADNEDVDNGEGDKQRLMKKVISRVSERLSQTALLAVPVKISTKGRFVLAIDDDKRIKGVEWVVLNNFKLPQKSLDASLNVVTSW